MRDRGCMVETSIAAALWQPANAIGPSTFQSQQPHKSLHCRGCKSADSRSRDTLAFMNTHTHTDHMMHVNSRRVLTSACAQHHVCSCSASSLAFSSAISLSRSAFCFIFLSVSLSNSLLALPKVGPPPDGKLLALKLPNAGGLPLLPLTPAQIRQSWATYLIAQFWAEYAFKVASDKASGCCSTFMHQLFSKSMRRSITCACLWGTRGEGRKGGCTGCLLRPAHWKQWLTRLP